jgi:hypothetical protein
VRVFLCTYYTDALINTHIYAACRLDQQIFLTDKVTNADYDSDYTEYTTMTKLRGVSREPASATSTSTSSSTSRKITVKRTVDDVFKAGDEVIVSILPDVFNKKKYPCTSAGKVSVVYQIYQSMYIVVYLCLIVNIILQMSCATYYTVAMRRKMSTAIRQ